MKQVARKALDRAKEAHANWKNIDRCIAKPVKPGVKCNKPIRVKYRIGPVCGRISCQEWWMVHNEDADVIDDLLQRG